MSVLAAVSTGPFVHSSALSLGQGPVEEGAGKGRAKGQEGQLGRSEACLEPETLFLLGKARGAVQVRGDQGRVIQ